MNIRRSLSAVACCVGLALAAGAPPASATPSHPGAPAESDRVRAATVFRVDETVTTTLSTVAAKAKKKCATHSHTYTARSIVGNRLYAHGQTTRACSTYQKKTGSWKVTSVKVSSIWRQTYWPGWDYINGHSETRKTNQSGRGMIQSHFRFEIAKVPAQNVYECLQIRVYPDSVTNYVIKSRKCSLY